MSRHEGDDLLNRASISDANAKFPRIVRFDETTTTVLRCVVVVILIVAVGYTWISYDTLRTIHIRDILRDQGSMSDGVVTAIHQNHSGVYVKYRFAVDGASYFGQVEMKGAHYRAPALGDTIQILYLPNKPNVSLPSSWGWFSTWDIIWSLFLLITAIASVITVAIALRDRQLARMGVVVEGRVTGCAPNQGTFIVYYEFATEDNVPMEGSSDTVEEYEAGALILVVYLRSNPKRNERYPVAGFIIEDSEAGGWRALDPPVK